MKSKRVVTSCAEVGRYSLLCRIGSSSPPELGPRPTLGDKIMIDQLRPYVAFAVDTAGVARATYEFACLDDEEAKHRAEGYLKAHDIIELWGDYTRIARLMRSEGCAH